MDDISSLFCVFNVLPWYKTWLSGELVNVLSTTASASTLRPHISPKQSPQKLPTDYLEQIPMVCSACYFSFWFQSFESFPLCQISSFFLLSSRLFSHFALMEKKKLSTSYFFSPSKNIFKIYFHAHIYNVILFLFSAAMFTSIIKTSFGPSIFVIVIILQRRQHLQGFL